MRKTAVVYWSGTGNTQMMAEKVQKAFAQRAQKQMYITAQSSPQT